MGKAQINVILTNDQRNLLKQEAKKNNRSLSNYVQTILLNLIEINKEDKTDTKQRRK